jgi:hypothetical protein
VWISCTCPYDGTATEACKHAVAALFALSDEVAIEPELIERWRAGSRVRSRGSTTTVPESGLAEVVPIRERVVADAPPRAPAPPPVDPMLEELARLLAAPNGAAVPEFPEIIPISHGGIRDRQLAEVLHDAIAHLEINWD